MAGKAGKAGKRAFFPNLAGKAVKTYFGQKWLEKLDFFHFIQYFFLFPKYINIRFLTVATKNIDLQCLYHFKTKDLTAILDIRDKLR